MKSDVEVVVVDDFVLSREGMVAQLEPHYANVRWAWNQSTLVKEAAGGRARLILLNTATAASRTLLQISLDLVPAPAVIVYGLSEEREWDVVAAAEAGAAGLPPTWRRPAWHHSPPRGPTPAGRSAV